MEVLFGSPCELVFTCGGVQVGVRAHRHQWEVRTPRRHRLFLPTATGLERATRTILREFLLQPTRAPTGTQLDFFTQPMDSSLAEDVFVRRTLLGALRQAALAVCPQLVLAEQALSRESDEQLPWLYAAPVFSHPYILSDIARYRPAALAALGLEWRRGAPSWCMAMAPTPERVASLMARWPEHYVAPGSCARSVARTLGALGNTAPTLDLLELRAVAIHRPVPSLLHLSLLAALSLGIMTMEDNSWLWPLVPIIQRASEEEVRHAVDRVMAALLKQDDDPDQHVHLFIQMVTQSGSIKGRTLGAVAKNVVAWFQRLVRDPLDGNSGPFGGCLLAYPNVPLPSLPGVRFISTPAELLSEGWDMHNCAATYMAEAKDGASYFFHVEHLGTRATVMLDAGGHILQSLGPCNKENAASAWGAQQLAAWAVQLQPGDAAGTWSGNTPQRAA